MQAVVAKPLGVFVHPTCDSTKMVGFDGFLNVVHDVHSNGVALVVLLQRV